MTTQGIPKLSLVVMIGVSGSGKSTFAARHFASSEIVSSDACRAMVSDDPNDQTVSQEAFELLHTIASIRLRLGRLTVIDATNVQAEARKPLIKIAREHHVLPVAVVLDVPPEQAHARNRDRPDRDFGPHVVRRQHGLLRRSMRGLQREGFRQVIVLRGREIEDVAFVREKLWNDRRELHGPFDLIGDVHGCHAELLTLLAELGYVADGDGVPRHPDGRTAVFLGDLVDRGPDTPAVLRTAMGMVAAGSALCVPGNHEAKLLRALRGRQVQITHGLAESLAQLEAEPEAFRTEVATFIDGLVSHLVLDDGRLVASHAGVPEAMQGRASGAVRSFALYGDTTGETDEFGLPIRYQWATDYRGRATVVYGHTPVPEPEWVNDTICVDTGCVFGGSLTALRYPERELVAVKAARTYYEPARPFLPEGTAAPVDPSRADDLLDIDDVIGVRGIETRLMGRLSVPEGNAAAALEVMSRFAVDPRWLVYLPPTMAPPATSEREGVLEHPDEAFDEFRREGVPNVICEEKHMGSRAVLVVGRDEEAVRRRLGIDGGGTVVTRTGRSFFAGLPWEDAVLDGMRSALDATGVWDELDSSVLVLDAEIMPWSLKAEELIRSQYASVGAAATGASAAAVDALTRVEGRGVDVAEILARATQRRADAAAFTRAYGRYVWPVEGVGDVRVAPFQIVAGDRQLFADREHRWHMAMTDRLAAAAPGLIVPTRNVEVDVTDPESQDAAVAWWTTLTAEGSEGMVVKPMTPIVRGRHGPIQPGIKVRGAEYLRIIYGPDYTEPANLERLRKRGLARKRSLAAREFALGIEALERWTRGEPLHRIHQCAFAVLALESEPVDPRL